MSLNKVLGWGASLSLGLAAAQADSTVVFNEIMYHPLTNEPALEWVELHNQMAVPMDISNWRLANGIEYTFPAGTVLDGGGYLVVAISPATLRQAGVSNVLGPFTGRLSNGGEKIELRNNNNRLMDAVDYQPEGDWPVAPDGGGPSLAKRDPATASSKAGNWQASWQMGGTPGARNFPDLVASVTTRAIVSLDTVWRYDRSGNEPGAAWKLAEFDDGAWGLGAGLFYAGLGAYAPGLTQAIDTLFSTGLSADRQPVGVGQPDPHYQLTASAYSTPPPPPIAATVMANHSSWLANDLNSLWIGAISQGSANVPVGAYNFRTTFDLTGYDPATAQISIETAVDNNLTNAYLNGAALGLSYAGFTAYSAPYVVSAGFVAGTNTLDFYTVNGGTSANPGGFRARVSGTAVKRYPTNTALPSIPVTAYFRRAFVFDGQPANSALRLRLLADDGAVVYLNGTEILRLNLPAGALTSATTAITNVGNAVLSAIYELPAAALVSGSNVLSVEVHQAAGGAGDFLFGAELSIRETNYPAAPPPALAFNEISSVTNAQLEIELLNYGPTNLALGGCVLARFGTYYQEYALPAQTLEPGGRLALNRATLGFGADPGDRLLLYTPGRTAVMDGVVAKSYPRARWPEGAGDWLRPSAPSFGASNIFVFHDEVVINEIMYHPRDLPASPAVPFSNTLVAITNVWRYDQSGQLPGPSWQQPGYDDSGWAAGLALFHTGFPGSLPAAKNTSLQLSNAGVGIITYYFRTTFLFTNSTVGLQLTLNPIVDDGAVFYLNGVEVYRYGLPAGELTSTTRAITNVGVPSWSGPVSISSQSLVQGVNVLAVEVHQYLPPPGSKDVAFGVELAASGFVTPALPERASPESWIELHNRGGNAVDLSGWRLDGGISFSFTNGTSIPGGGYLVVAKDVGWMQANHPSVPVTGPFSGRLARGGEKIILKDAWDNPADKVHYYDAKPWPSYPDGGGSSLELRDPRADNSRPEAWAASDESAKSSWQTYSYRGTATVETANSPTLWREFVLGLLGEGEVLLDDLSVIEAPSGARRQLLQNGGFDSGLTAWRILGNHRGSGVITDPSNAANKVLRLRATGDTEHMHNHAETTLAGGVAITNGVEYEISFRARWMGGCHKLHTRLYFNRLARTTELTIPALGGTPGARNSRFTTNAGPTFANLRHSPAVPTAAEPVTVSLTAADPDGLSAATLYYSVNGGAWQSLAMSAAGAAEGVAFSAVIPAQAAGTVVQFYAAVADGLGVQSTCPSAGANSRALYKVGDGQPARPGLHTVRLVMTPADVAWLHTATNVMSNDRLGCTVITGEREIFYDAGVHLQGSERGRNNSTRVGFTVRLPAGQLYRGVHDRFTVDRSGGYSGKGGDHDEILLKYLVNKAGGLPGMYDDLCQFYAPRNAEDGTGLLILAKYGDVFLDSQYQDGAEGEMYKLELIYYPTTTASGDAQDFKLPNPDTVLGTDIKDLGDDPEAYRWVFLKENHVARDNYAPMMALAKAMSLTGANFEAEIKKVMDVDEWIRAVAFISLCGGGDIYTYGNSHNLIMYFRPEDQKGMAFLWDLDYSFVQATNTAFPGAGSPNTTKLITSIPDHYRRFYNHLWDLSNFTGDTALTGAWASRYASLLGENWSGAVNYLAQRAAYVRGFLPLTTAFAITNNNGNNFAVAGSQITLGGTAPISVREIEINGIRYPITWLSMSNWTATVLLPAHTNLLVAQGIDNYGNRLANATDSITITNSGVVPLAPPVINEWMADNKGPGGLADPADGLFQDWFELYNPNSNAYNLSGLWLTDDLAAPAKWQVPSNVFISARGFLLVWTDGNTNQNPVFGGTNVDLHADFSLNNAGEAIGLFAADGVTPLAVVEFGAQHQNVSQGRFPDGDTNTWHFMTNWSPRAANRLGAPPAPDIADSLVRATNGVFGFSFAATPLRTYRLEYKERVESTNWLWFGTNVTASGPLLHFNESITGQTQRFYRVRLLP